MSRSFTPQRSVTASEAVDAFVRGQGHAVRSNSALRVTQNIGWSYAEPVAAFDPDRPGTLLLTREHFSTTTSKHVGQVRRAAERHNVPFEYVDHDRLRELARI